MGATGQNYPDQRSQHGEHCIQSGSYVRIGGRFVNKSIYICKHERIVYSFSQNYIKNQTPKNKRITVREKKLDSVKQTWTAIETLISRMCEKRISFTITPSIAKKVFAAVTESAYA